MPCHFGEVFAQIARGVLPRARARGLALCFDCHCPELLVDIDEIALCCGLHRLCLAVQDLASSGLMMMDGGLGLARKGQSRLTVRLSAAGTLADDAAADVVLHRLLLSEPTTDPTPNGRPRLRRAEGICPRTGAAVSLAYAPAQGVVITVEHGLATEALQAPDGGLLQPIEAPAWVVGGEAMPAQTLALRLGRLGWGATPVMRPIDALRRLRMLRAAGARDPGFPALLVLLESDRGSAADDDDAAALAAKLTNGTHLVRGVALGSPALARGSSALPQGRGAWADGFDVHALPFGPRLLRQCTHAATQAAPPVDSTPQPPAPRRPLLVVDDEPCNRVIAVRMLRAMGERAYEAEDGLQAIACCRETHPSLVLMDIEMPELNGLEATRTLRALQAAGEVAPCPIIAASSSLDDRLGQACLAAGMDDALRKPLTPAALRQELDRFCPAG